MRKVLLFITLFIMSSGIYALPFSSWASGDSDAYEVTGSDTPEFQTLEVNKAGALAAFLTATGFDYDMPGGRKKLIIKGYLNSADFAAINSGTITKWANFTDIDFSEATFTLSDMNGMALENLEYIILPVVRDDSYSGEGGFSGKQMADNIASLNTTNPKLKIAASLTFASETLPVWTGTRGNRTVSTTNKINVKRLALYSWQKNSVQAFVARYPDKAADIDKLDMAGAYGDQDLWKTNSNAANMKVFTSGNLHYFDFTGATFEENVTISYTTKEEYGGTWDSGDLRNGQKITVTTTNALYYLRNYVEDVYTCKLPTGNTEIPPGLFFCSNSDNTSLMEIEIPEGYTSIGEEAFYGTALTSLYLPSTMTHVAAGAFYECRSLVDVEMSALKNPCSFDSKCFMFCTNLKHFTMGEGVTDIADQMFEQCWNLEYIRIPSTCEYIGNKAFVLNMNLHAITIPDGVQRIDHQAFFQSGLTDVYLLATSPSHLPKIYAVTSFDYDANSSFTRKDIIGENTPALQNEPLARTTIADSKSDQVPAYYQEALSGGRYLGANQCLVNLHYPQELNNFINGVTVDGAPSLVQFSRLDGKTSISDEYQLVDKEGHKWPAQDTPTQETSDYRVRFAAGNVTGQTIYGWRQFALSAGSATNYSKLYDETWYTICFPWNVSDTQLFEAFNQKCEIVEFKGAEVIADEKEENAYSLVLHFDEVAQAHYMDYVGFRYNRYDDGEYTITTPVTATFKKYKYVRLDDNGNETGTEVTFNPNAEVGSTENNLYYQIENILAVAGHPYMIHPAAVGAPGSPSRCTIAGVRRVATTNAELTYLEKKGEVTRAATTGDAQTAFESPIATGSNKGGSYTFHGYLGRNIEADGYNPDNDKSDIPKKSYFLATAEGENYPKFYRKMAAGTKKWTLYTAIITPDADALANIEALDGTSPNANVAFGEWEQVEATAIAEIIAEAQERGEEVREVHLNVVYNINGQVVRNDGQLEGLPQGLYIVNGKKYMVK